ncbi:MAG: RusA family crossover junction endodeoxyribonuclease [Oscillospiraceae bacterium]|nr:RusA family crossover junction endodeoxyribonuclease [Oscillospiraceae bacterium]
MRFRFTVPGEPVGKGRPRVVRRGGFTQTYTPEKTASYENLVKLEFQRQGGRMMKDGPVYLSIQAWYGIPKSVSKRKREAMIGGLILPTRKPDCDNVAKIIADALNGLAWRDDSQVVSLHVEKRFGEVPGVEVEIREV